MKAIRLVFALIFGLSPALFYAQMLNMELLKGQKIRSIGPAAMSGRVTAITVAPNDPDVIYAGTASGGLWRSSRGGVAWQPIFDKAPTQSIGSVAISPRNPDEIWVGTGEGNPRNSQNFGKGVFKSLDGGKNWKPAGLENSRAVHRLILHRDNSDVAWAAVIGSAYGPTTERGVFKTTDGGKTWRKTLYINELTGCADLVVDPQNPQKLIAAMWEYERKPYFFNSGGKGSGIFISFDGGETWEKRTEKDGLPEGNLGRIGLAVARSNPKTIYALVEAKENALFKSTDGGFKWQKMATKGIGDRPFYFGEIYADPHDEQRLYTIFTTINRSEDGGKNFESFTNWNIHPDNHAFWISPDDSNYLIDGNDGGLNISKDGGKTWRFAENLPVGQFYHLNLDNDLPYNLYGGLQDNGSWVGPSSAWHAGGIRNSDWQEVLFGDGFDVMPRPSDSRFLYAASQGGHVSFIDKKTGDSRSVQPVHPEGKKLRFNWNAAMAQDPFHDCGIYYGSQFLHRSLDCGQSWKLISPDLTTNDTSKLHQDRSGGLTLDATNAENHCTIIAIAPSPLDENTIWVGTDDGNLQHTTDGGKTWQNLTEKLPNCPKTAWIPQIEASKKSVGEAWVVVNNYRQNDWRPFVFYTTDGGATWKNIADEKQIGSYALSILPDPTEPNLIFLGADDGLYISINKGTTWQKWTANDFPSVNVMDMKMQERDGDLAMATFGRSFQIMDDVRPLREIARTSGQVLEAPFKIFQPADAILASWRSFDGPHFPANAAFAGENKGTDARIAVWLKPKKKEVSKTEDEKSKKEKSPKTDKSEVNKMDKNLNPPADSTSTKKDEKNKAKNEKEKATVWIFNDKGDTIRTLKWKLDSGLTRQTWGLEMRGVRYPSNDDSKPDDDEPSGPSVLPGVYKLKISYGEWKDSTMIKVLSDVRIEETMAQKEANLRARRSFMKQVERATKTYDLLKSMEKTIKTVEDGWQNVPDSLKKDLLKQSTALKDSLGAMKKLFRRQEEGKGILPDGDFIVGNLYETMGRVEESRGEPFENVQFLVNQTTQQVQSAVERVNRFYGKEWSAWREKAEALKFSLFKDLKRVD